MAQRYKHGDRQLDNTTCFMVTSVAVCVCERACVCVWQGQRKVWERRAC